MRKCKECGNITVESVEYCSTCGSRLPLHNTRFGEKPSLDEAASRRIRMWVAWSVIGGICFIGLAVGIFFGVRAFVSHYSNHTIVQPRDAAQKIAEYWHDVQKDPQDTTARKRLIEAYLIKQEHSIAEQQIEELFAIDKSSEALYEEVAELLATHNLKEKAARLLMIGYGATKSRALEDKARSLVSPGQMIAAQDVKRIVASIFDKPLGQVTWADMARLKYMNFRKDGIDFSFEDSSTYKSREQFEATIRNIKLDITSRDGRDIMLFSSLTELHLESCVSMRMEYLTGLQMLKSLEIYTGSSERNLQPFGALPHLEQLSIGGSGIESLEGITQLPGLKKLELSKTSISDISILSSLKQIESIALRDNDQLKTLEALGSMTQLKQLTVVGETVFNLSALASLHNLESLVVHDTATKDISFVSSLPKLRHLSLQGNNKLKNIGALTKLTNLEQLQLDAGNMDSLSPLTGMTNLRMLKLRNAQDLSPVRKMIKLRNLEITNSFGTKDLSPLANLTELEDLNLSNNTSIEKVKALSSLSKLKTLNLSKSEIYGDLSIIKNLTDLETLDLSEARVQLNLAAVSSLKKLKSLNVNHTVLLKNVFIQSDGFMTNIWYDEIKWDDVLSNLGQLTGLQSLTISRNDISSLKFVKGLTQLQSLDAGDNSIADISPLAKLTQLKFVNLADNPINDWSPADKIPDAQVVGRF